MDGVEWLFKDGKPLWPVALWEETRLDGHFAALKANQVAALRVLAAHLAIPAFLIEVDAAAQQFRVHGITEGSWTQEFDRRALTEFIEGLRR